MGQPVRENPTGVMQEAAFAALGLNWRYLTVEVAPERLHDAIVGVRALGMRGANLTIPHKVAVMEHLDEIAADALLIGAVNTVRREGERLIGENTDGKGFLRGLREDAGIDPAGKRAVVLGAGGASRAVVTELALAKAAEIVVVNRSTARGAEMAGELARKTRSAIRFEPWRGTFRVGRGSRPAGERDFDRTLPGCGCDAARGFGRCRTSPAGGRRGTESSRNGVVEGRSGGWVACAGRAFDAGTPGRDRTADVDGARRSGGSNERGVAAGAVAF